MNTKSLSTQYCSDSISNKELNGIVFWTPFSLITLSVIIGLIFPDIFGAVVTTGQTFILKNFSWLFSITGLFCLVLIGIAFFSQFGNVVIGGKKAKPVLSKWQWFSITLCTTIAINILFWPIVEPLQDMLAPPLALGFEANTYGAAKFSLASMYMNWGLVPYSINALPALVFAICYYNLKRPFSLGSILYPLLGERANGGLGKVVDIISLYALALGMGTSLGTGVLMLSGGLSKLFPAIESSPKTWGILIIIVMTICIVSSVSGLMKGMRILSELNAKLLFGLMAIVFIVGPTVFILDFSVESFGSFVAHFFERCLFTDSFRVDSWPQKWTVFSFANYMIWAPISALFLGRISKGYTVKEFISVNVLLPMVCVFIHASVFSSTAIWQQLVGGIDLQGSIATGIDEAVYILLGSLPLAHFIIPVFLFAVFISFITAADSTTNAMASLTTKNLSVTNQEAPPALKVAWGVMIGTLAFIMLAFSGLDGMKTLTYLGGAPITLVIIGSAFSLIKLIQMQKESDLLQ
ncbi:BCCT family transporter [Pseudodesulfovibrio sp. JC047]|uniref:BCCT family transporter n=1 Tax=Pseudodesulfovibrio sp. JC047 TaxID=2683199 RepID=UPI0013D01440|nr:BCCT family transporter [Pseudodesulfovibrio sp. JC047]NDV19501.1 BCCT family transporter [Pseudodesulfovibrio sp. JC047]